MKNPSAGFYSSSLEMLLDTMCNMLGGVVFIALMVAVVAQDSTVPTPEKEHEQTAALTNELAMVISSNNVVQVELEAIMRRLQDPNLRAQTNVMRLPNLENTTKKPWIVIVQENKLFPLDVFAWSSNAVPVLNRSEIVYDPHSHYAEPRPGQGRQAEIAVNQMVDSFKANSATNYYFAFLVRSDSFDAFIRARAVATKLGFQYGWTPLPQNERIQFSSQGERVLPQN